MNSKIALAITTLLNSTMLSAVEKPNILFIMSDDHAYQAISAYSNERKLNKTPNIDSLAKTGMMFDRAYVVNSICGPSRAAILTGKYSHKNNYKTNFKDFDASQMTFPKLMTSVKGGYETAVIGKWHLGSDPRGFDYWNIISKKDRGGQGSYYNPIMKSQKSPESEIIEQKVSGYNTNIIAESGIKWIKSGRDKNKPFMMMLHFKAPHREWEPHPSKMGMLDIVEHKEPSNLHDDYKSRGSAAHYQTMSLKYDMLAKDTKLLPPGGLTPEQRSEWAKAYNKVLQNFVNQVNDGYFGKISKADFMKYAIGNIRQYGKSPESIYVMLVNNYKLNLEAISSDGEFSDNNIYSRRLVSWKYRRYMDDYLATISSVDDAVGEVVSTLKKRGFLKTQLSYTRLIKASI